MDTTKDYIKMCEKTEEVQSLRKNHQEVGDYFSETFGIRILDNRHEGDYSLGIWLPRQDQLQEMVDKTSYCYASTDFENNISLIRKFEEFISQYHTEGPCGKFKYSNASLEQLWLAFVMKEKYNKIWNGEEWTPIPPNSPV